MRSPNLTSGVHCPSLVHAAKCSYGTCERNRCDPVVLLSTHVIGSFAEFERDVIVERVKAGLANARAKGKQLGRPVKDPGAAHRVAALRAEGMSLRVIAAAEGISASGVRKMLLRAAPAVQPVED